MARKRYSDEDCLTSLREIELQLSSGLDMASVCRSGGSSDPTYHTWPERFGGMARSQLAELKTLEKENSRSHEIALGHFDPETGIGLPVNPYATSGLGPGVRIKQPVSAATYI